eukprot:SAG11_NODE_1551_length_4697_cov_10.474554_5_plen_64_part_00
MRKRRRQRPPRRAQAAWPSALEARLKSGVDGGTRTRSGDEAFEELFGKGVDAEGVQEVGAFRM